jgi:hypothetical protein
MIPGTGGKRTGCGGKAGGGSGGREAEMGVFVREGSAGVGEPEGAEGGEDLVGFLEVELGDVVVVEDDQHVVGDDGGVVPVEGAVEDDGIQSNGI